ncbi:hypothetical protein B484DRAFT_92331 [Ochromonadaceae sp. CCMP2298]|nr:hypothetical protein B484DRAFT_92331 [Ochromonadaceae sp. CCMP2298]
MRLCLWHLPCLCLHLCLVVVVLAPHLGKGRGSGRGGERGRLVGLQLTHTLPPLPHTLSRTLSLSLCDLLHLLSPTVSLPVPHISVPIPVPISIAVPVSVAVPMSIPISVFAPTPRSAGSALARIPPIPVPVPVPISIQLLCGLRLAHTPHTPCCSLFVFAAVQLLRPPSAGLLNTDALGLARCGTEAIQGCGLRYLLTRPRTRSHTHTHTTHTTHTCAHTHLRAFVWVRIHIYIQEVPKVNVSPMQQSRSPGSPDLRTRWRTRPC